jgi:hypothetical protein
VPPQVRDLIAIALGLKPPPWIQVRTIVGTVSVEDGQCVYSGLFTAQAEFTPRVITNNPPAVKVSDRILHPSLPPLGSVPLW